MIRSYGRAVMKKLIIALLLCLIPFESHAGSRADRYRPKRDYKLATEIVNNIANGIADSVDALNKDFYWLDYNRKELIYIHCIIKKHNGKFYNEKFCKGISERNAITLYMVGKVEGILREDERPYSYDDLLIGYVNSYMDDFFKDERVNIVITNAYYVEPEYTIIGNVSNLVSELLGLFRR